MQSSFCLAATIWTLVASAPAGASESALRLQLGVRGAAGILQLHSRSTPTLACNEGPNCHLVDAIPGRGTAGRLQLEGGAEFAGWLVLASMTSSFYEISENTIWRVAAGRQIFETAFGRTSALLAVGHENGLLGEGIAASESDGGVLVAGTTIGLALRQQANVWGPLSLGAEISYDLMLADKWAVWDDGGGTFKGTSKIGLFRAGVFVGAELGLF